MSHKKCSITWDQIPWNRSSCHAISIFRTDIFVSLSETVSLTYADETKNTVSKDFPYDSAFSFQNNSFIYFRYLRNNVLSTLASHGDEHAVNYSLTGFRIWMKNQRLLKTSKFYLTMVYFSTHSLSFLPP